MEQHKRQEEIDREAIARGTTPERIKEQDVFATPARVEPSGQQAGGEGGELRDGYSMNQGRDYSQAQPGQEQEDYYDPTHSGVRHAQHKPGTRVNTPGREGQPAWAEQLQMGRSADTPQRDNPAD